MEGQREDKRLRRFLKISITEGVLSQVFSTVAGPGSAFLTRFAIMINATPFQFGILSAIGQLSQIFQPLGSIITRKRLKRKPIVLPLQFSGRASSALRSDPLCYSQGKRDGCFPPHVFDKRIFAVGGGKCVDRMDIRPRAGRRQRSFFLS